MTSVSAGVFACAATDEARIATAAREPWRADRRYGFMRCLLEVSSYYPPNFQPIHQFVQQEQGQKGRSISTCDRRPPALAASPDPSSAFCLRNLSRGHAIVCCGMMTAPSYSREFSAT